MQNLIWATLFFIAIHLVISGTKLRDIIVGLVGEKIYGALFSIASLVGIVWMIRAYPDAKATSEILWVPPKALLDSAPLIMLIAFLLVVVGSLTSNPTALMSKNHINRDDAVKGITHITRHPAMWGFGLWGLLHMAVNGHDAAVVMFGGFALTALAGTLAIDSKRARAYGDQWQSFKAQTSNVPFAALLTGRTKFKWAELSWWRPLIAFVLFIVLLFGHRYLFGVSPIPGMTH